ncbi:MAG: hypothetical protein EOO16_17685 [Chitinophagaceae bacterium]|nr:MAG: hypothetical protein EOO16_17685 [Chitinophagaceae bacterium]
MTLLSRLVYSLLLCGFCGIVNAQSLETGTLYPQAFCPGASTAIPFSATGTFGPGNVFTAQLSDASGSFASPVTIGTLAGTASSAVPATIPLSAVAGGAYRVRVLSSAPALTGAAAPVTLTVRGQATVNIPGPVTVCNGNPVSIPFSGNASSFNWTLSNPAVGSGLATSGTGDMAFMAINNGTAPATSTVQVVPNSGNTGAYYVPKTYDNSDPTLLVMDAKTDTLRKAISFPSNGDGFADLVVSHDGSTILVATTNRLYKMNAVDLVPELVNLPQSVTMGMTLSPDGSVIYMGGSNVGDVVAYNATTLAVVGTYNAQNGQAPYSMRVSPDGRRLYVAYGDPDGIYSYDSVTPQAAFDVATGSKLYELNFNRAFVSLLVSANGAQAILITEGSINFVNAATGAVLGIVPTPYDIDRPTYTLSPDGQRLYIAGWFSSVIYVYDVTTRQVIGTVSPGMNDIGSLGISQDGRLLYIISGFNSGRVHVFDLVLNQVRQVLNLLFPDVAGYWASDRWVYSVPAACSAGSPELFTVTVYPTPSASINYSGGPFCTSRGSVAVTRTGTAGGRFWASTPGLSVDAATGAIDLAQSQQGTYTVSYRAANPSCDSITATTSVQVFAAVATSISYPGSPYCTSTGTGAVFFSGFNGGSYSAVPAGLVLDATTGAINIGASQSGNYTVTYTANNGACNIVATTPVTIRPVQGAITDNRAFCGGTITTPIGFGSAHGLNYSWTNDNPAIGLAASGTGPVPSFNAVNNGGANAYANIYLLASGGTGCDVKGASFRITVKPKPSVNAVPSQNLCAGSLSDPIAFGGNITGATYSWTNNNATTGLAAAGTGNIAPFYAVNNSPTPVNVATSMVSVTPAAQGCTGDTKTVAISVRPSAGTLSYSGSPFCPSGWAYPTLHGSTGGTFTVASGTGLSLNPETGAINLAASEPGSYVVLYTRAAASCNGAAPATVVIKTKAPTVTFPNQVFCAGTSVPALSLGGNYTWTNSNLAIGLASSGTGSSLPAFTTTNAGTSTIYAQINVTPTGDGAATCGGRMTSFRIAVNPIPSVNGVATFNDTFCRMGVVPRVNFTGPIDGTKYGWTASSALSGIPAERGVDSIPSFLAQNPGSGLLSTVISVQPVANKCAGAARTYLLNVDDCYFSSGPPPDRGRISLHAADFSISPNPATTHVVMRYTGKEERTFRIRLLNQYGQVSSRSWLMNGSVLALDLAGMNAGTYLLLVTDLKTNATVQRQLVKF